MHKQKTHDLPIFIIMFKVNLFRSILLGPLVLPISNLKLQILTLYHQRRG